MGIIVEHKDAGKKYILLGTGFGAFKASRPSVFFGDWLPKEESGELTMVAVCDDQGQIGWIRSEELTVVQVEGRRPAEML